MVQQNEMPAADPAAVLEFLGRTRPFKDLEPTVSERDLGKIYPGFLSEGDNYP